MLSEDIICLENFWRGVLLGSHDLTAEACEMFLDSLQDARLQALELEAKAVAVDARHRETPLGDNVVVLRPCKVSQLGAGARRSMQPDNGGAA